jgi:hypothetical protein
MNSLIICTGEINVKEGEVGIAYSTRERLEMRNKRFFIYICQLQLGRHPVAVVQNTFKYRTHVGWGARRMGTPRKLWAWMGVQ